MNMNGTILMRMTGVALAMGLVGATTADAAIINGIDWREVSDSNTTVASGSIETDGLDGGGGDQTDNNWDYTTPFGVIGPGDSDERTTALGTGMLANNGNENPGNLTVTLSGVLDSTKPYTIGS